MRFQTALILLLADYLHRPEIRATDVDQMVLAAFRRPTLGLLLDMCPRVLRAYTSHEATPFVPELADLHVRHTSGVRSVAASRARHRRAPSVPT